MENKFKIQEDQYAFPYHYLVDFKKYNSAKFLNWGLEYYSYLSFVMELVKKTDFDSLLDVGCGDGKMIYELSSQVAGKRLVGADLSGKAIAFAKAFNFGNQAEFYEQDFAQLPGEFDLVTLVETLEHIPDKIDQDLVDNIYAKLKSGGKVIVSVPSANIPLSKKHYRHYTLSMLQERFKNFRLEQEYYLVKTNWLHNILVKLTGKLGGFKLFNNLTMVLTDLFIKKGSSNNCRHLVCVFVKD